MLKFFSSFGSCKLADRTRFPGTFFLGGSLVSTSSFTQVASKRAKKLILRIKVFESLRQKLLRVVMHSSQTTIPSDLQFTPTVE